jgi:DNA helicase-2/ATP-dependent DNA helicase PcrA
LIERNQKRIPKDTTPSRDLDDTDCVFTQFDLQSLPGCETNQRDYATLAVDEFQRLRRTREPDDFVFLFRTKLAAAPVEFLLEQRGIPFVPLAKTSLLTNPTSIWVIAWLRVINSPSATAEDWKTVLQRPTRYLTNATLTWLISTDDPYSRILEAIDTDCEDVPGRSDRQTAEQLRDSLREFQRTIDAARRFPDSLAYQLKQLDLPGTLNREHTERISRPDGLSAKHQGDGRSTDPRTVYQIMALMAELAGTWQVLELFIDRAESDPDIDLDVNSETPQDSGALQLLTIHQFKGRERPIVFVLGPKIGYMPDSRAHEPEEVEEERRVAYVAATRAKERLYFWCSDLYEKELTQRADGLTWTMYRQGIRKVPKMTPQPPVSSSRSVPRPVAVTERQPGLLERALKWLAKWV